MFGNRPLTTGKEGGFRTNSTVFITFFNLINSLVKHFQNSQITMVRNSLHIFKKTQSYGLREPSKGTNIQKERF